MKLDGDHSACDDDQRDVFISHLIDMFSMRNKDFSWCHMITFDNMETLGRKELLQILNAPLDEKNAVIVRTTPCGDFYLKTMSTHYEYFASRFMTNSEYQYSLFSKESYERSRKNPQRFNFEYQIETILLSVKTMCQQLAKDNDRTMRGWRDNRFDRAGSDFIYEDLFYEERVIHHHISYIEEYRKHLASNIFNQNSMHIKRINEKLLGYIEDYLNLLSIRENFFYSKKSRDLYCSLNKCVALAREEMDMFRVEITIDYFNEYVKK